LEFSFSALTGGFPTFAFGALPPNVVPPGPPIIPVGVLIPLGPQQVTSSGDLVAFDMPVVVGSWSVRMADVPEPSSSALMAVGLVGILIALRQMRIARAKSA
jgi:hypothetical protein